MPTTLTGLLLLIVILLPGITYVALHERKTPEQRRSAFRETATVATVSIAANAAALGIFALVRIQWPDVTPDVGEAVGDTDSYFGDNYAEAALWGAAILATGIMLAVMAALIAGLRRPHPSVISSWWLLFDDWPRRMSKAKGNTKITTRAACVFNDGSIIEGTVKDFNRLTDETPDRDLIMVKPLARRNPDGSRVELDSHAVCISARDIRTLLLYYLSAPPAAPESLSDPPDHESGI